MWPHDKDFGKAQVINWDYFFPSGSIWHYKNTFCINTSHCIESITSHVQLSRKKGLYRKCAQKKLILALDLKLLNFGYSPVPLKLNKGNSIKQMSTFKVSLMDIKHTAMPNFDFAFNQVWFGLSKKVCNSLLAQLA